MMENDEMIYTAIFQNKYGTLTRSRYTGVMDRQEAWKRAAALGKATDSCLIALVPGDHPVYTYESLFNTEGPNTELKNHDVFEVAIGPRAGVYEMT